MSRPARPPDELAEIREETLRFFYGRQALPHPPSAVLTGLQRAGHQVSAEDVTEAINYLTDKKLLEGIAPKFTGRVTHWKITSAGKDAYEARD